MELLWLEDAAAQDLRQVGGKVAHLSRLAARYTVPTGFCLTTEAFHRWTDNALATTLEIPSDLHALLLVAYSALAERTHTETPRIAVRSSAVDEDGAGASFAGQYDTFLNITGVEAAAQAVLRCWQTARSERVCAYRRQHGLPANGIHMAVLLQQMVTADAAAFIFSANPITNDRSQLVINAAWGLGASIADGTVTPDTYIVSKEELSIVSCQVADKQQMTVMGPDGTREVPVPRFLRMQPALTDSHIQKVAQLALSLEAEMGWPVDVECAWSRDQLYLLQCRPVTALLKSH
ncbi:MAG: PEP/pyruvate-binding domain-containing protein [Caldilineaceae bacterium]|nr:PEP/pyruvate-binding domain-containing protein [Caldilineaceae bacterium]